MSQNLAMANVQTEQNLVAIHLTSASLDTCRTNTLNVRTPAFIIPTPAMENVWVIQPHAALKDVSLLLRKLTTGAVEMNALGIIFPVMELAILTQHPVVQEMKCYVLIKT